jgi:hypothetical protein
MSLWVHDGSRVFNAAAPVFWQDLDLKAVAGGGATSHPSTNTLALLKVENSAGAPVIAFRQNGSAYNTYTLSTYGHGCCLIDPNSADSDAAMVLVPTDADGIVEWYAQTASAMEIWLVGYVEATFVDLTVRSSAAMPSTWTALDLTTDVLAASTGLTGEAFAFMWWETTGGFTNDWASRPSDPGWGGFLGTIVQGGCSQGGYLAVGIDEGIAQKTNSSGELDIIAVAPVPNASIQLAAFEQENFASGDIVVYASAAPPTSWTSLDLSAYVGAQRALVMLQVLTSALGSGTYQGTAFRTTGDASDYLPVATNTPMGVACSVLRAGNRTIVLAETAADGTLEWISSTATRDTELTLVGMIPSAPTSPTGASQSPTGVMLSSDSEISFELLDDYGLDMSTLVIQAIPAASAPITVYTGGAWQTGWSGMISEQATLYGSNPTKAFVRITDFSDAFIALSPRRCTMSVDITNIVGQAI